MLRPGSRARIFAGDQVECTQQAGNVDVGRLVENISRGSALHDSSFAENQHFFAEFEALVQIVSDEKNRSLEIRADLAQHFVEFGAQWGVEALGGLIEQQQFWRDDQCAGDGAALALASGNFVRAAAGGFGQAEGFEHFVDAAMAFQARAALGGEDQILAQRHVREQRVILKHVAAVAGLRGEMDARRAVEQQIVVEQDAAFIGAHEARDRRRAPESFRSRWGRTER